MHQIHGAVGFQQVPPGALARIGLAGDQQHPKPVAHAVDRDHRGVVAPGQLAGHLGGGEFQHVDAAALQRDRERDRLADRHVEAQRPGAVERDRQRCHPAARRGGADVLDAQGHADRLADDGEGGRCLDDDPPVPVGIRAGQQHMHRPGEIRQRLGVVDLSVGDEDRPGDAVGRDLRRGLGQRAQEPRAVLAAVAHADLADLQRAWLAGAVEPRPQAVERLRHLIGSKPDPVRGALVDHHERDTGHRQAVLLPPRRLRQRHQQHQRRQRAQPPAGQPAPERDQQGQDTQGRQTDDQAERQLRIEGDHRHRATAPAGRAGRARAPGRICSCRS